MSPADLARVLASQGYQSPRGLVLALAGALDRRQSQGGGLAALLLEGQPGSGKSAAAEATAAALGARLVVAQLHEWSDADELFVGVDVAAAVGGDASHVRQPGVLAVAAEASHAPEGVVLLLDEVDKTSERTEALLLDWLQSGRVPVQPGRHLQTRAAGLLVILTSNAQRPLGDALQRRVRRVWLDPLPAEAQERVLRARLPDVPPAVVATVAAVCRSHAQEAMRGRPVSLQELGHAVREAWSCAESIGDLAHVVAGWAGDAGSPLPTAEALRRAWGEITAARR